MRAIVPQRAALFQCNRFERGSKQCLTPPLTLELLLRSLQVRLGLHRIPSRVFLLQVLPGQARALDTAIESGHSCTAYPDHVDTHGRSGVLLAPGREAGRHTACPSAYP